MLLLALPSCYNKLKLVVPQFTSTLVPAAAPLSKCTEPALYFICFATEGGTFGIGAVIDTVPMMWFYCGGKKKSQCKWIKMHNSPLNHHHQWK